MAGTEKIIEIRALLDEGWQPVTKAKMAGLKPGTMIAITRGMSTSYDAYLPPRHRNESPVAYYKRTKCVDDRYFHVHKGRYYCNPAHCLRSWKSKDERDKHLEIAYAILD
jgi:hypothetical protein